MLESVSKFQGKINYSNCFVPENPQDFKTFYKTTDTVRKILTSNRWY
jgi:hypothetical protein